MTERITDISGDLAEIAGRCKKEAFLKRICGFRASLEALESWGIMLGEIVQGSFDESLSEAERSEMLDALNQEPSEERIESFHRLLFNLPIPSTARSESVITGREKKQIMATVTMAREVVLSNGKRLPPNPDGLIDPILWIKVPEESGASYDVFATPDRKHPLLWVDVHNPIPEIDLIKFEFSRLRRKPTYAFLIEFADREIGNYETSLTLVSGMALNEGRIIQHYLDNFLSRYMPERAV